jgi:threonine/homoserine/homoserine lactone efflux protein
MEFNFFLRGMIIGFSIAAPVGPIGILCIRRTLAEGPTSGLISGLGAATADAIYGFIAGFGLTFISNLLISQQIWFRLLGGGFLCYLGIKTFFTSPLKQSSSLKGRGLISAYISTFFLTLTNPITILSFMAIFAGLGVGSMSKGYIPAGLLVAGVFIGSALWWLFLSKGVGLLGKKFNLAGLRWTNRISGIIITAFGVLALLSLKG